MKITKAWLKEWSACAEGADWFLAQAETDGLKVCKKLLTEKHLDWANWLVVRMLSRKDRIRYAVYAAEQVIGIYEAKYPDDKRPRKAIEAAKACIENDTEENRDAAFAAWDAAWAAVGAAGAAAWAAGDAAWAAGAAAVAAGAAAGAAVAAGAAAGAAGAAGAAAVRRQADYFIALLQGYESQPLADLPPCTEQMRALHFAVKG